MYWGSRAPGLLCKGNGQCNWPLRSCLTNHWQSCRDISFHCSCLCSKYISKPMIVVKHVDPIFGSLLPIRLSTFKLVDFIYLHFNCSSHSVLFRIIDAIHLENPYPCRLKQQLSQPLWMTSSHSFHSLEAKKRPISFTLWHKHPGIIETN